MRICLERGVDTSTLGYLREDRYLYCSLVKFAFNMTSLWYDSSLVSAVLGMTDPRYDRSLL
jgi:hypothetical protein